MKAEQQVIDEIEDLTTNLTTLTNDVIYERLKSLYDRLDRNRLTAKQEIFITKSWGKYYLKRDHASGYLMLLSLGEMPFFAFKEIE